MPAEAATHLPWLSPCAASLVALARAPTAAVWEEVRCDPGCVLLLVRHAPASSPGLLWTALVQNAAALDAAARHLERHDPGFADWDQPALRPVHEASFTCAHYARTLAQQSGRCDADSAWIAGLLAPLGWLAAAAGGQVDGEALANLDGAALARRLNVQWRLPAWLAAVTGHLGLPVEIATSLGADAELFRVAQLAVCLARQQGRGLNLVVGAGARELVAALGLTPDEIDEIRATPTPPRRPVTWEPPDSLPLLADLLRLAAENRRLHEAPSPEALHREVDALQAALIAQRASEGERLQCLKLAALAELAAGAGHEINNPLAVISGQAQYLLKRLPACPPVPIPDGVAAPPTAPEPRQLASALEKIVSQANRIHQTLTELMKFARPPAPKQRSLDVGGLLREVAASLGELAEQRQVRLVCIEPVVPLTLYADPDQAATALRCLLRNAIEAAPAEGWAGVRAEADGAGGVALVVEDSGPGPSAADREHLFDPFYSGRKAGRGRGLGLPTAWRLAREHGGDVYHDAAAQGPTRFILRLPQAAATAEPPAVRNGANGCHLPSAIAS